MIGRVVAHYEIVEPLGEGGMGVVYKARDTQLRRLVALKALPPDKSGDEDRRRRFRQEARAASALNHPNIVVVYELITEDDGSDFIAMELVQGTTLRDRIGPAGLSLAEALGYAYQIADAVAAAHAAGIVHRDLKPGNVMITDKGLVKVLDFGLAKLGVWVEANTEDATATGALTRSGLMLGTLAYMSPEQVLGEPVDPRSDVFALGVILFEMLSGIQPFLAKTPASTIHNIGYGSPRLLPDLAAGPTDVLRAILDKALARRKEDRYPNMDAFAAVLREQALAAGWSGLGIAPRPSESHRRVDPAATEGGSLPRAAWVWAGAAVLAGLAATAVVAWRGRTSPASSFSATSPATLPSTPYDLQQEGLRYLEKYYREGYVDLAARSFEKALALQTEYAPAYAGLARTYWRKHRETNEPTWLDRAHHHAVQATRLDATASFGRVSFGFVEAARGEKDAAREAFEQTLELDPANADAERGLADLALSAGDSAGAEARYARAIERRPLDQELHGSRGAARYGAGRYAEAALDFARSIELAPDNPAGYRNLAAVEHMLGRYAEAAAHLQKSLEIRPDPIVYSNLGTLYFFQGLYQKAVLAFERGVELGASDHLVWGNLGDAYRFTPGNEQKAAQAFTRAIQLLQPEIEKDPRSAAPLSQMALYRAKRGDTAEARSSIVKADALKADADSLYRSVLVHEIIGDREQALKALAAALDGGYSAEEVRKDPELTKLRSDVRYHRLMADRATATTRGRQ